VASLRLLSSIWRLPLTRGRRFRRVLVCDVDKGLADSATFRFRGADVRFCKQWISQAFSRAQASLSQTGTTMIGNTLDVARLPPVPVPLFNPRPHSNPGPHPEPHWHRGYAASSSFRQSSGADPPLSALDAEFQQSLLPWPQPKSNAELNSNLISYGDTNYGSFSGFEQALTAGAALATQRLGESPLQCPTKVWTIYEVLGS